MSNPPVSEFGGPLGWPQLSLYMTVRDAAASLEFYRDAFGFETTGETMQDDQGRIQHAGMRLGNAAIMFAPESNGNPMRAPVSTGATVLQPPADQFWGDRIAIFKCPDGYQWTFATHVAEFKPED